MTDKQIIIEKGNQKCIFYNDDICRKGDKTRDCLNCARVEYHSLYKLNWENQERLESQLKAKEQECERLENENKRLVGELANHIFDSFDELDQLKQTLTEIREIVEKQCVCGVNCQDMKIILQKISECEGNDGN